jgi:hypothetical protein
VDFPEISDQLEKTKQHLQTTSSFGTVVESYLTNSLLIAIYAEFEGRIKTIINAFVNSNFSSKYNGSFFIPYVENLVRRLKTSELTENILSKLGPDFVKNFKQKINENQNCESAYNNIIINRNKIAHGEESNITFRELEESYPKSLVILEFLDETIKI